MVPELPHLDEDVIAEMTTIFNMIRRMDKKCSDVELRCLIVAANLRGFASACLALQERGQRLDMQKTALSILGTAAWLKGDLETDELELNR